MDTSAFLALVLTCAPQVAPSTAHALVAVESALNPWAIGVVGGRLARQPMNRVEALATARALRTGGWNFSVGLGQINVGNFQRLGLTLESAFEPCTNLAAMQAVLIECLDRSSTKFSAAEEMTSDYAQHSLRKTLSCYYSGNLVTGFDHGYVHRVAATASVLARSQAARPSSVAHLKETP
jgi:type IV secretion system protein VirB1